MSKRIFSVIFLCLFSWGIVEAASVSLRNLQNMKVDEITDSQMNDFIKKYKKDGYTMADVERMAKAQKMPSSELEKLKQRVSEVENSLSLPNTSDAKTEVATDNVKVSGANTSSSKTEVNNINSRVFGASLFANSHTSFEPSQSIATPRNYVVGESDEIHVDVYGFAEATYDLTVSREGNVRIPNVGLISVGGKTLDQVERIIKNKLVSIYSSLGSGNTTVSVSINKIRSIRVFILGEVRNPGSYVLNSVSSVFNAMSACGGPSDNGSFRNVKLIRGGKEIATVDLYEFLLNGVMPSDVTLRDQDVIQVPTYEVRVSVNGFVKREGIYELKNGETLQTLLDYCGGFTDDAYTQRVSVARNKDGEKSVADVTSELFPMFTPAAGDVYTIGQILDKYTNRVQILGKVFRPGVYALEKGMTLYDLVQKANGLTEDAFLESATIVRLQEDLTPEIISFNVNDLMNKTFNDTLQKEDVVTIGAKTEFEPNKQVAIYGAVFSPGVFPYYENITLKDLVFFARGFREDGDPSKIEVVRKIKDADILSQNEEKVIVYNLTMERDLTGSDGAFKLEPRDKVTVRQISGYEDLGVANVFGEVSNPGFYSITSKVERLSEIMKRAGGLTKYAYPKGAFLLRSTGRTEVERRRDIKMLEAMKNEEDEDVRRKMEEDFSKREDLIGIDMVEILKNPSREETNLIVEKGDIIYVPKKLQTVTISGAVQVPGMEVFNTKRLRKYVKGAGGFGGKARRRSVYVAYANGSIESTKSVFGIKKYPKIEPGAHIYVPEKPEKNDADSKANATFFVSLFSSIATMGSVVISAIAIMSK